MTTDSEREQTRREELEKFVGSRISALQSAYLSPGGERKSSAASKLARLRRAVAQAPGENPDEWSVLFDGMPERLVGKGDSPSPAELAAHTAITLYAIHQQSQGEPMHHRGRDYNLGTSVRRFVNLSAVEGSTLENGELPVRFAALVTADSFSETQYYLRQLVHQLKGKSVPLDYALLAGQLYDLQFPQRADGVRLSWGRAFARSVPKQDQQPESTQSNL